MPNFKTHLKVGFWVGMTLYLILLFTNNTLSMLDWRFWLFIPIVYIYSNIPDIDHFKSKLRKYIFTTIFGLLIVSVLIGAILNSVFMYLMLMFIGVFGLITLNLKHRRRMHRYLTVLILSLPLAFLHWSLTALAFSCAASHILLDTIMSYLKLRYKRFCTNSFFCRIFRIGVYNSAKYVKS